MNVFGERYVPVGSVDAPDGELIDAIDSFHARPVALLVRAVVPGAGRDELGAQTRALMSLPPHPNVSTVRDAFFASDRYAVVMDRPEGHTLAAVLAVRGEPGLPVSAVLGYLEQLAAAVDHLHRQRPPVVHGDVRPERVLVTAGDVVVLMFAGTGSSAGTASDIAGFGATAVQLLTGMRPGTARDAWSGAPMWEYVDTDAAKHLSRILRRALDPDPARRPGSAGAVVERLRAWRSADLPTGAVTFLLTDIEGSAALWEAHPLVMASVIARHHEIVADCIDAHDGRQPRSQGEGDSTLSVFSRPSDAIDAVLTVQRALGEEPWPEGIQLRVRAGLHTGEAEVRGGDYFGASVSRTARIRALARGGQVLLSQATAQLAMDRLPAGAELSHLGRRALKGLAREEDIFQLRAPGLVDAPLPVLEAAGAFAAAATRTLPRDVASFTGRAAQLAELTGTVADAAAGGGVVGIYAIGGMAGIGKTTLAVHAAHQLAPDFPDGQFFLPLHAHTPGQRPVDPVDALASLLLTAGVGAQQIPPGLQARAALWRDRLAGKRSLLVLDDAASHEQVSPLLPGTAGSLVLVTSRRHLTALADAAAISLDTLSLGEAAALLARLSGRPELGSGAGPAGEITRLCGYLPLAIGMLAGQLRHHPAWTAESLGADLAAAAGRLELMQAENLSVAAAFDLSYQDLTTGQQRLFRRLGLHPGPDIDAYGAAALDDTDLATARRHLDDLYDQHLLTEPASGRYRLHDLLREHARALAAADDPADCDAAVGRLLDYYLHTALAASRHAPERSTGSDPLPPGQPPACAPQLSTPRQAAAWLETERPNLHAAASCAAAWGRPLHAVAIPAAMVGFLRAHGHWDQAAALHQTAVTVARQAGDRPAQASALVELGVVQHLAGDYPAAAASHQQALALFRDLDNPLGQAYAVNHLGTVQRLAGDYPAAAVSHQEALALFRDLDNLYGQAFVRHDLGVVQRLTGDYTAAAASLTEALALYRDIGDQGGEAEALNSLGELLSRTSTSSRARDHHTQALAIARDIGHPLQEARALEGIGQCHLQDGNPGDGTAYLRQALTIYQRIGAPAAQRVQGTLHDHGI
jgi:class 3 adenylate cyclase/tetratricopeptide (TPR) repeat protein